VLRGVFDGLDDAQLAGLIRAGSWMEFSPGMDMITEGEPVARLFLICEGRATVCSRGSVVGYLDRGEFVGTVGFLTNVGAIATVRADSTVRALSVGRVALAQSFRGDHHLSSTFYKVLGDDLARKLAFGERHCMRELA
jgi:eukaryotic-like serine/threonine-protein kinase